MRAAALSENRFAPASVFSHVKARLSFALDARPPICDPGLLKPADVAPSASGARAAAVLVGLVAYPGEVKVILTLRASALRVHSGQIAFPGGKIEAHDHTPVAAALREAHEEIGLESRRVEPLGYLDPYLTGTGFHIIPVVAKVSTPLDLRLNRAEVEESFETPFAFLMDAANHSIEARELDGKMRQFYAMPYGERHIWGVTAGILRNLYERLYS